MQELVVCMKKNKLLCLFSLLLLFGSAAQAAKILQIKASRALIELESESAFLNQKVLFLDPEGRKTAEGYISKIKSSRAIINITVGTPSTIDSVEIGNSTRSKNQIVSSPEGFSSTTFRTNRMKISGLLGLSMNTMTTKQTDGSNPVPNTEDVALKGTSITLAGAMDYPLNQTLVLRGMFGYEPFSANGSAQFNSCDNLSSTSCTANINYLSGTGILRFDFGRSRATLWGGLGATFKFPISKSSTALLVDDIKTTTTFLAAGGLDYFLDNKSFIPVSVEYQLFQKSDTVSANIIMARIGYGWAL